MTKGQKIIARYSGKEKLFKEIMVHLLLSQSFLQLFVTIIFSKCFHTHYLIVLEWILVGEKVLTLV